MQSALVCRVLWFGTRSLTPSTISTSPEFGQSDSRVSQAAGHVEQPWGIHRISNLLAFGVSFLHYEEGRAYTATCVVYALMLRIRTLSRPGPVADSVVVESERKISVSPEAYVRFNASAVA